ncbi:MAG: dTMP kinase [Dehalococcoidales bacterium]|nr:dTMP kinase [Dehalococcoidales bacterium]
MSLFITFEGGEGSGKSVQTRALYRKLCRLGIPAILIHEPGSTALGEKLTRLLKWARSTNISPLTELILFNASRAQLAAEIIKPALSTGKVVICDRFADSTIVYQGYGRGLDIGVIKNMNAVATNGLNPNLTVLLDIPVSEGFARKRGQERDRFEQEDRAFHKKVRAGYLRLAGEEPERWLIVDASQPKEKIKQIIWEKVSHLLSKRAVR